MDPRDNPHPVNDFTGDWRLELLSNLSGYSIEDQEYILRAALLIDQLNIAFETQLRNGAALYENVKDLDADKLAEARPKATQVFNKMFKPFIDQVWRESHRGHPERATAIAVCQALQQSHTSDEAIRLLKIRGYVRLAATLDTDKVSCALEAWFDRSRGTKPGRIGKFTHVSRLLAPVGLKISAATVERLWRDKQGMGRRAKKAE